MKNINYQAYLNASIKFDKIIWDAARESVKKSNTHKIESFKGKLFCDYEYLAWDSKILGVQVAQINNFFFKKRLNHKQLHLFLLEIDSLFKQTGIAFAFVRLKQMKPLFLNVFKRLGWKTADTLNIYEADLTVMPPGPLKLPDARLSVREPSLDDALLFFKAAKDLFSSTRIYRDLSISRNKARTFYRELFISIFNKATCVSSALYYGDKIIGLAIGDRDDFLYKKAKLKFGHLWEIGIVSKFRGKGYSAFLLRRFLWKMRRFVDYIEIGTQSDNTAANRLYVSDGLKLVSSAITLHKWYL